MAFSKDINWEVRTTGDDTNSGGFNSTATGVDYSQQDAPQYSLTGLTTAAANAIVLSASASSDMFGNVMNITGGTNFITGWYEIIAVSVGVSMTVDRNCTSAAGAAGTCKIGGSFASVYRPLALEVPGNISWIKYHSSNVYTITTKIPIVAVGNVTNGKIPWRGYDVSHGDDTGNRPNFTSSTNGINLFDIGSAYGRIFQNMYFTHTAGTRGIAFEASNGGLGDVIIDNCICSGCLNFIKADNLGAEYNSVEVTISNCNIYSCTNYGIKLCGGGIYNCRINANAGGILVGAAGSPFYLHVNNNIISNNTNHGIDTTNDAWHINICNNIIYNNTGHGINNNAYVIGHLIQNNIFDSNAGYAINFLSGANKSTINRYNAYRNNGSGTINNLTSGSGDVSLTADPFTNAAGGNFGLNAMVGGGASLKNSGFPQTILGSSTDTNTSFGIVENGGTTNVIIVEED